MTADLAESIRDEAERRHGTSSPHSGDLLRCCEGSTYTNVEDSMILHLNPPQSTISAVVERKSRTTNESYKVNIAVRRSWAPLVNFCKPKTVEATAPC